MKIFPKKSKIFFNHVYKKEEAIDFLFYYSLFFAI